jgi:rRNA-processing protein FCF1
MAQTTAEPRPLISARVERELAELFVEHARKQDRSVASALRQAMRRALEREQQADAAT